VGRSNVAGTHPRYAEGLARKGEIKPEVTNKNVFDYKSATESDGADSFSMRGARNDVFTSDGESVFMQHLRLDREARPLRDERRRHLFSTSSLLDGDENHRSHWVLGTGDFRRTPTAYPWMANNSFGIRNGKSAAVPVGIMLAFDDEHVWVVQRGTLPGSTRRLSGRMGGAYELLRLGNRPFAADEPQLPDFREKGDGNQIAPDWKVGLGMRPRAMIKAAGALFLGGMPLKGDTGDPYAAYEGRKGGVLWTVSPGDGSRLARRRLPSPPVWDGLAAAGGRLYVSTMDGQVLCLGHDRTADGTAGRHAGGSRE
jgi:hypothetical protein